MTKAAFAFFLFAVAIVADALQGSLLSSANIMTETPTVALAIGPVLFLAARWFSGKSRSKGESTDSELV